MRGNTAMTEPHVDGNGNKHWRNADGLQHRENNLPAYIGNDGIKAWRVDEFIPKALDFYRWSEKPIGGLYFRPIEIVRFLTHPESMKAWHKRLDDPEYQHYISNKQYPILEQDACFVGLPVRRSTPDDTGKFYLNVGSTRLDLQDLGLGSKPAPLLADFLRFFLRLRP